MNTIVSHDIQGLLSSVCRNNRNGIKALGENKFQDIFEDVTSPMLLWCHMPTLIRGTCWKRESIQTPVTNTDMDHWIHPSSVHSLSQLLLSSWSNLTDLVGGLEGEDWGIKGKYWSNILSEQTSEYRETPHPFLLQTLIICPPFPNTPVILIPWWGEECRLQGH